MRFASFLSSGFTIMAVMNQPEKKLEKRTSVQCLAFFKFQLDDGIKSTRKEPG